MLLASLFLAALAQSLVSSASPAAVSHDSPTSSHVPRSTVGPTETRSLVDIVYSCLSVIFLCTYISVHHNIPDQRHSAVKITLTKLKTMFIALVAPEIIAVWAMRQRAAVSQILKGPKPQALGWTRTHAYFLLMGGLMVHESRDGVSRYGVVLTNELKSTEIPYIPEREIKDRGKGDVLSKLVVLMQLGWFVVRCVTRAAQGLVVTQLELTTLAFAALSFVTYVMWWDKPLNVQYPIYLDKDGKRMDGPKEESDKAWYIELWTEIRSIWKRDTPDPQDHPAYRLPSAAEGPVNAPRPGVAGALASTGGAVLRILLAVAEASPSPPTEHIHHTQRSVGTFYSGSPDVDSTPGELPRTAGSLIGAIFGGIHLVGWNVAFSTPAELWLWRGSALAITVAPVFYPLAKTWLKAWEEAETRGGVLCYWAYWACLRATVFLSPLYIAARFILLFLAAFMLRRMPESAYQDVDWVMFMPHIRFHPVPS